MHKKFLSAAALILTAVSWAAAYSGLMAGQKEIKCISTEYFDIIYTEDSALSAAHLARNADGIYREICAEYGISPSMRMPVTLSPATDVTNAYFMSLSYNHIVLYDTPPDDIFDSFSDPLCDMFRHELTHALTVNMKNPFWSFIGGITGDAVNTGVYLNITTDIKEGAAIAEESRSGGGRLNDPYYMHMARQAKIQGTFPSNADVRGARDTYPGTNMSYAFGGPFTKWLQDEYGMEKYARFWYEGINSASISTSILFRKVYGRSINDAWAEFREWLPVPDNIIMPEEDEGIKNFPGTEKSGWVYSSLCAGGGRIAWLEQKTSTVWMSRTDEEGKPLKPRKFLDGLSIDSISLSSDGQYLAVSYYDIKEAGMVSRVALYGTEKKQRIRIKEKSLRNPFIMQAEDGTFLYAVKTCGQCETLVKYRILEKSAEEVSRYEFPAGDIIYSPVDFGGGRFACIYKSGGRSSIRIFDSGMNYTELETGKTGLFIKNLSVQDESTLIFSCAEYDTLPRLGRITLDGNGNAVLETCGTDVSGGVYFPAASGEFFLYAGNFVYSTALFMRPMDDISFDRQNIESGTHPAQKADRQREFLEAAEVLAEAVDWKHPLYTGGTTVPFTLIQEYAQTGETRDIIFLGLSWAGSNPWDGNYLAFGGGFSPWGNAKGGFTSLILGGASSLAFSYQIIPSVIFYGGGFLQATVSSTLNGAAYLGGPFYLNARNSTLIFAGHQETAGDGTFTGSDGTEGYSADGIDPAFYLSFYDSFAIQLSSIRRMGKGPYNTGGFALQLNCDLASSSSIGSTGFTAGTFRHNIYPSVSLALPALLPFSGTRGLTYNLPVRLSAFFAPTDSTVLASGLSCVLFSAEIQKGLTFFPLYFNRVTVSAEYSLALLDPKSEASLLNMVRLLRDSPLEYRDSLSLTATFAGTVNSGIFASVSCVQEYGLKFTYYPRNESSPYSLSFVTSLNF